ncbi:MAG TPA: hypothetical protein VMK84_27120 [Streptosporangiaceae bacterium]|nr:hypothetical protein [Streptosporangiaceae bacterium]
MPQLQRAEGIVGFIRGHLGQPIASTAVIAPMSREFAARLRAFAGAHAIPCIDFARGQRKDEVMHEHLARFEAAGRREGVLFIGRAQEKNTVFRTEKRRAADGRSYPWIVRTTSVVNQFYVHCVDEDFGAFFVKFSSYFPYGARLLVNGHHYAQARAAKAGIGFTALDNGFAACDDVPALQAICDSLDEDKIEALARKWLAILPNPYSAADQAAGYRYDISVLQAEFSLTQVLDKPLSGRIFFDQVIHDNLAIGRPGQVGLIFDRKIVRKGPRATPGRFRTRVITSGVTPSLHVDYKNSKIKQYHKLGKALRTETTVNDTRDFGIGKRLTNLPALRQVGFSANRRLLAVQKLSHDPIAGAGALAQVTDPVITATGTRVAGLRLTDPRALALLHVLCVFRLLPHGFTNAVLRHHLAPLIGMTPDLMTSGQITYDLRRLRMHGLIERIPGTFRYQVTDAGMRSAQFLTRLHDRVLRTGLAEITDPDPPASTALRAADRAYQTAIDDIIRHAGLAA